MAKVNPYITFNGDCEQAFLFYKSVFGGEFAHFGRYGDMPSTEDCQAADDDEKNKVMHVSLPISDETILMGSDSSDKYGHATAIGNNIAVSIDTSSKAEAEKLYNELSQGGTISMPLQKTFWGAWFAIFIDKFSINWMINFDEEPQQ